MQLCLVNNDPGSTPLITPEGEPLYSIETPPLPYTELVGPSSCPPQSKCTTTTVKRIERYQLSTGHVETSIGVIEFCGPTSGAHLLLCSENHRLDIEPGQRLITDAPEKAQGDDTDEKCVFFFFVGSMHLFISSSALGNLQDQTPDGTNGKCLFNAHGYVHHTSPAYNILILGFCSYSWRTTALRLWLDIVAPK